MVSEIKKILKNLCCNHGWCYAVFWSYHPTNSMLLRFEDGYNDEESLTLVDDMLLQAHILGQGIIGEAALTGNHQWLLSENFQCENEFQNQFLSGLKTIAIVPVKSRGVIQLGSTQKILVSPEMLEETTRALHCYNNQDQTLEFDDTLFESLVPLGDFDILAPESLQGLSFDEIFNDNLPPPLLSPDLSSFTSEISDKTHQKPNSCSFQEDLNNGDDFGFDILNSYSLDDLYQLLTDSPEQNGSVLNIESFLEENWFSNDQEIQDNNPMAIQEIEKDLFDILGINSESCSSVSEVSEIKEGFNPTNSSPKGLFSELGIAELISNSFSSTSSSITNYNQTSFEDYPCLNQTKRRRLETTSAHSSTFFPQIPLNKPEAFVKTQPSLWIDDVLKKPDQESVKKKRAKPGESTKPRPKDRQMIQDRIKELRGMIPNGAKCSIDTLLDLTIKHMMFMQSIAKYADKLKQPYEPKLVNQKGSSVEERVKGDKSGATWALEVGDETVICPIIVEDLNPPGQMQIEMLCEEGGQFLEIGDVIKSLGLNILKGVMETRQGKIWTHFIVEAKGHVTRLEVLWSLVQLLQQPEMVSNNDTGSVTNPMIPLSETSDSVFVETRTKIL